MHIKNLLIFFFNILLALFLIIPTVFAYIDVPISTNLVTIDGVVNYSEWVDAYHVQLNSFDGGYFDFFIKYDYYYEQLQIGFKADDSNYDEVDRIGFFFDTENNGGISTDIDDFALVIYRKTSTNYDYYPDPIDSLYVEGTGSGFFTGDSHYDPIVLPLPFSWFILEKNEINPGIDVDKGDAFGNSWEGEFSIGLSKTYLQGGSKINIGFGLEYWDYDYYGNYIGALWYPPSLTDSPNSWETLSINYSEPTLFTSIVSPSSGTGFDVYPITLVARVTSDGWPVYDALTDYYIDGSYVGYNYTDFEGYSYFTYYPSEGTHNWYISSEKIGYLGDTSSIQSFTYREPNPMLSISQLSPVSGTIIDTLPIQLTTRVTSDGAPVSQAIVDFYVGGEYIGYSVSDNSGYAYYQVEVEEGTYGWYATASKTGYIDGISSLNSVSYEIQRYYLTISSDVYVQGAGHYKEGEMITLSAVDKVENYLILKRFDSWIINDIEYRDNPVSFSMETDTVVYVFWQTDYTRIYLAGLLGLSVLIIGGYSYLINEKKKATAEEKLLIETETNSIKERIIDKLNQDTDPSINLYEEVETHVTVEDAKKILDTIIKENDISGWYTGEYQYITEKTLNNRLLLGISESNDLNEPFDIVLFSRKINLESSLIRKMIESLINEDVLEGYLTSENKFIPDKLLKEKISEYLDI